MHQDGSDEEVRQALEALEKLKWDAERERLEALRMREEAGLERQRLKKIMETIKERRLEIYAKTEEKARRAIQKIEEELKEWARRTKDEKSPPGLRHKELREMKDKFIPSSRKSGSSAIQGGLKVGERVRIESLRSDGVLTNVVKPLNRAEVVTDKAKVTAPLSEIVQAGEEKEREGTAQTSQSFLKGELEVPSSQLNVIGLSVEDALSKVDKFIDQALLHGLEKVQIVHGVGSGRLRNAIGQYLSGHRAVKSFSPGETLKGGRGITIVELR